MTKRRVFITGGAGFIGARLTRMLVDAGHDVAIYDSFVQYISPLASRYQLNLRMRFEGLDGKFRTFRGDTREPMMLLRAVEEFKPDIVVHLAALPISDLANVHSEEAMGTIVSGTTNCLEVIRDRKECRFVYISSSMVYGDFEQEPAPEDHPLRPKEVYGGAKLAGEVMTQAFARRYGLDCVIVRPSAVYGPTDVNRRVSQIFVENALSGKPLILHDGGSARLDFTYIDDIARGILLAALSEKAKGGVFNLTAGEGRSLKEFAEILRKEVPELQVETGPGNMFRPRRGALDIRRAREVLGYEPQWRLERGIPAYVDFYRSLAGQHA
jgi:nucleoside-diphosphate-sugar epimerase